MTGDVDWVFWTLGGLLGLAGLSLIAWALFADRAKGRKRCPKCWFDMTGSVTLVLLVVSGFTIAADDAPDAADNAALWYWRAIGMLAVYERDQETRAAIEVFASDPTAELPDELQSCLESAQWVINELYEAASRERCVFAIDYENGPRALLPHLRGLRSCVVILCADARIKLEKGQSDMAAKSLAASYRLAIHLGDGQLMLTSVAAYDVFKMTDQTVVWALENGLLTRSDKETLEEALVRIARLDPLGVTSSLEGERRHVYEWAQREFSGEEGALRFARYVYEIEDRDGEPDSNRVNSFFPRDRVERSLEHLGTTFDELIAAFAVPDRDEGERLVGHIMAQLEMAEPAGDHVIAGILIRDAVKFHKRMRTLTNQLEVRLETLRRVE